MDSNLVWRRHTWPKPGMAKMYFFRTWPYLHFEVYKVIYIFFYYIQLFAYLDDYLYILLSILIQVYKFSYEFFFTNLNMFFRLDTFK